MRRKDDWAKDPHPSPEVDRNQKSKSAYILQLAGHLVHHTFGNQGRLVRHSFSDGGRRKPCATASQSAVVFIFVFVCIRGRALRGSFRMHSCQFVAPFVSIRGCYRFL
jgi:hypothetical protein